MLPELAFVALFAVATAVALLARRLKVPYTVALVFAGLVLGSADVLEPPRLTKELLYAVFLPGLIFEAAYALEFKKFWQNKTTIFSLALPGMLVAVVLTAVVLTPVADQLHFVDNFTLADGLIFAAVIAATDPIAVVALFKSLGAPKRLAVLIEGESLLNDGTAVVVFTLITAAVVGGSWSVPTALLDFVRVVGAGGFVGAVIGYAVSKVIQQVDDPMIEITLTTIAAYGSFVVAEHFHFSGVIATVVAGMLCGNYAAQTGMSATTRVAVGTFWEYLAFALNSIVFLLIGFEVKVGTLIDAWKPILVAWLVVTVGRAVVIFLFGSILRFTREKISFAWAGVLTWGGLRGGLSMVLVLGLPRDLPHRDLLVAMTFGVVIVSILLQGLSMGPLLRKLGLVGYRIARLEYERLKGARQATQAAIAELERLKLHGAVSAAVAQDLANDLEARRQKVDGDLEEFRKKTDEVIADEKHAALRRTLIAEKAAIVEARRQGIVGDESYEGLVADVDARLIELESRVVGDEA